MINSIIRNNLILGAFLTIFSLTLGYGQFGGNAANFAIDANLYSGYGGFGLDDWFQGASGVGIIDETRTNSYRPRLAANNNISFVLDMGADRYANPDGYLLYDAKYMRDYIKLSGNDVDQTTFARSKNGEDPSTWTARASGVSGANDIVDAYIHIRRDGATVSDDLWMFLAITTLESNGDHYFDFEMLNSDLTYTGTGFINSGPEEGHTAWKFDAAGEVIETGDLIVGFAVSGGGITAFEVRIWVSRSDFNTVAPANFTWGPEIDGNGNGSTYGYAQINISAGQFYATTNTTDVAGPPWGTHANGAYSMTYPADAFAEVGINLSAIGLSNFINEEGANPCDNPFSKIMTKSRASQSFTSALADFTEPIDFAASSLIDSISSEVGSLYSCGEYAVLVPENPLLGAYYEWTTTDGLFSNGTQLSIGDTAFAAQPGTYTLSAAPLEECTRSTTDITIDAHPCAADDSDDVAFNSIDNIITVLANDFDFDGNLDTGSVNNIGVLQPSNGTVSIGPLSNNLLYTPDVDFIGFDTMQYYVCDSTLQCDTAFVILEVIGEFCNNGTDDDGDGLIDCLDEDCGFLTLSNVNIGGCINDPLMDRAILDIEVAWSSAYSDDTIVVAIDRKEEYIAVDFETSPVIVSFQVPADGSLSNTIDLSWKSDKNVCVDSGSYDAPAACSADSIVCDILYLHSYYNHEDGDSWDQGWLEYLDKVNGTSNLTSAITLDDASGLGLYDPMDTTQALNLNFEDYGIIIISATTQGFISSDLVDTLSTMRKSILLGNYDIIEEMGYGTGEYLAFQDSLFTDDVNGELIYNYNNLNSTNPEVFSGTDLTPDGLDYLWLTAGSATNSINASFFEYDVSASMPSIGYNHSHRVFLGYHLNGVYANSSNSGSTPVPVTAYFDPVRHLTAYGKIMFDQAIIASSQCDDTCPNAYTNPHVMFFRRR